MADDSLLDCYMETYRWWAERDCCGQHEDLPDSLQVRGIPIKAILCVEREGHYSVLYQHAYQIALEYRQRLTLETALAERTEAGYLEVIGALARALADLKPEELKRHGSPLVGYSREKDRGIVGYLKSEGYSSRSDGDLQKKISAALKLTEGNTPKLHD